MTTPIRRTTTALVAALLLASLLAGCSDKTIDGSSVEAFHASIERWDLQGEERHAFGEALRFIAHDELSEDALTLSPDEMQARLAARLDGFTHEQVIEEYNTLRAELEAAIEQLEQRQADDEAQIEYLLNQGRTDAGN